MALDFGGVPAPATDWAPPGDVGRRRVLREDECIQIAARASSLGNLLDAKASACCRTSAAGESQPPRGSDEGPPDLRTEILRVAALEARNQSAGIGLELFYRLEQARAQRESGRKSLAAIDRGLRERALFREKGLTIPKELDALQTQRIDLLSNLSTIDRAIVRLSAELGHHLNLGPADDSATIWPLAVARVEPLAIDPEAEVRLGLARRPEIQLLRRLDGMQAPETLRSLETVMTTLSPMLGIACGSRATMPSGMLALLHARLKGGDPGDADRLAGIRRQWDLYRQERERQVAKEIRTAALDVLAAQEQVAISRLRVDYWRSELDHLEDEAAQEINTFAERTAAELKLLEAQATVWEKVTAWKIAVARLRAAQFLPL